MNKKGLLITIIVITAVIMLLIIVLNNQISYKKLSVDSTKWESIINSRTESTNLALKSIKFNDYNLLIDENSSSLYYSVIDNISNKYEPDVSFEASSNDIKIAVLEDEITDEKIAENHQFQIVIYNDKEYRLYNLICTNLPILSINYNENTSKNNDIPMNIYLFNNSGSSVNKVVRSKGKLNIVKSDNEKKDYSFSLFQESLGRNERENNISILNMSKHNEYILNSMYDDTDKIRNIFSTNLWNETAEEREDAYNYVELFVNGEYIGLYSLGYNIEREKMMMNRGEFIFFKNQFSDSESSMKTDERPEGYVLYDNNMIKVKKKDEPKKVNEWNELYKYYEIINGDDAEKIKEVCDLDNSIKLYLFYMLTQASNNVNEETFNNTYLMFKNPRQEYFVKYYPWNLNGTFGNNVEDNSYIMKYNPVTRLIELGDEETINKVKEIYTSLRNGKWSLENINNMISNYENELSSSGAYLRDMSKWSDGESLDLSDFKEYVQKRLEYMDEYIKEI